MYKIILTKKAKECILNISDYIGQDNLFYSRMVVQSIESSINILKTFPLLGKEISPIHRQLIEPKYKFKVVYRVESRDIIISAIFREQQDWK